MSYKCTSGERCVACNAAALEFHHVQSRKSGGPDEAWNLAPMCRSCHSTIHSQGRTSFAKKNNGFYMFLVKHEWKLCILTNKYYHN